ncbi:16S rRNA (guanine(527)-N(7))-methyltransferase RsmG [Shinella sumterensis]|uniref:16S rRNA (guanine(527)-N(7))-methyltransferase RsmG n=1 Tax=Shinella sumterensis TaxID=1967501 RepID=UPI00106E4687|nr:16S rRNA (guanine(527)-N(7))-methyltransferase RsmG [Shinella sumterensis]MCD1264445.1 16S rRNA (guanine(527)-N(7))-methyltransferase RsmG [Shinella sumterensis]MDP9589362.1 16S rRNA (guanine527-N7)-methyltransferase [Shinella zoogloeoides]TFE99047.1 16S rRNA (guanine(527)-N(7))-methyltransferase RsmG [Shinella sumterensis]
MTALPRLLRDLDVSRETEERLTIFVALFQKWAKAINLVAPSTLSEVWNRHIVDSAQIYALRPGARIWADLGSGGGFPGIVTGILLAGIGDGWVHLVESNNKKAAFLRTAILETGARASVHAIRIEQAPAVIERCDAISARALADLDLLLEFGLPWAERNPDLSFFLHKGRDYQREVDKALGRWRFDLVKHASVVEPDSVVLEIAKLSRQPQ